MLHSRRAPNVGFGRPRTILLVLLVSCGLADLAQAQLGGGLPVPLPIDVETVEIDGDFLRNGAAFPGSFFDGGAIDLETARGDVTFLGNSWNGSFGPLNLVRETYTPRFTTVFAGPTVPRASGQAFAAPTTLAADQTWDLDVPAVRIEFTFRMNGAAFSSGLGEVAHFILRDVENGQDVMLGTSEDGSVTRYLVPGTYDVFYAYQEGIIIPRNENARVLEGLVVADAASVVVDVPMVARTFFFTLDGGAFPPNGLYDYAHIRLENDEGDRLFVGRTSSPAFVRLMPGTYRATYEVRENTGEMPLNTHATIDENVVVATSGTTSHTLDVGSYWIDPTFLQNGTPPSASLYENGRMILDGGQGDRFEIGELNTPPNPVRVVAGSYEAYYERRESVQAAPWNPNTLFAEDIVIAAAGPLVLDLPVATLSLALTLNGETFPDSLYDNGAIWVADRHTETEFSIGRTDDPLIQLQLMHGTYDIVYEAIEFGAPGGVVPANTRHVIAKDLVVAASGVTPIDVRTRLVSPTFSMDGGAFATSTSDHGAFFLRDPDGDEVALGLSNELPDDLIVIEGAYTAEYQFGGGLGVPRNSNALVSIVSIPEPGFAPGLLVGVGIAVLLGARSAEPRRG